MLIDFIAELQIENIADLIGYVEQEHFEREWREIIEGRFPVVAPVPFQPGIEAAEGVAARPAVEAVAGFESSAQRILVSRMRSTYRKALGAEKDEMENKALAKKEALEADMEKPIDGETRTRLRTSWSTRHGWEPVASIKGAPKLRNRVVREFAGKCMTNHVVEKAVTALQAKHPVEPERLPVGPPGATATLLVERERPQTRVVSTLLAYFAALRVLLGTYAYCGTHKVESQEKPGAQVEFSLGGRLGIRGRLHA